MKVMPIRYVAGVDSSARFYAALGLSIGDRSRSGNWAELTGSAGVLALHSVRTSQQDTPGYVQLSFESDGPLELLAERLAAAGFEPDAIVDENFGRSLQVTDPDGMLVQVSEHDPGCTRDSSRLRHRRAPCRRAGPARQPGQARRRAAGRR